MEFAIRRFFLDMPVVAGGGPPWDGKGLSGLRGNFLNGYIRVAATLAIALSTCWKLISFAYFLPLGLFF
jgi:hypothetical protein